MLAAVSSTKWTSFYSDPHPDNNQDTLGEFGEDEVTSSGEKETIFPLISFCFQMKGCGKAKAKCTNKQILK